MRSRPLIVTLDGPAGSGKSTVARCLAVRLDWPYLDSGAIYRGLALTSIRAGVDPADGAALLALARALDLRTELDGGELIVRLGEEDVTAAIRLPEVTGRVSEVSAHAPVRETLRAAQRGYASASGLVAEGRDMGTVVFPEAQLKYFLVASLDERARRRQLQLRTKGVDDSFERVRERIAARDDRDSSRDVAPLVAADDAREVDTTGLTIEAVVDALVADIERARRDAAVDG